MFIKCVPKVLLLNETVGWRYVWKIIDYASVFEIRHYSRAYLLYYSNSVVDVEEVTETSPMMVTCNQFKTRQIKSSSNSAG